MLIDGRLTTNVNQRLCLSTYYFILEQDYRIHIPHYTVHSGITGAECNGSGDLLVIEGCEIETQPNNSGDVFG